MTTRARKGTLLRSLVLLGHYAARLPETVDPKFRFQPGVNLLVGPNGTGKSTILEALWWLASTPKISKTELRRQLRVDIQAGPVRRYDFEKDNPRVKSFGYEVMAGNIEVAGMIHSSKEISHGETTRRLFSPLATTPMKGHLLLLDEPDQALDYDGQKDLAQTLALSPASQILVATHSPILMFDPRFHCVELVPGYLAAVRGTLRTLLDSQP